MIMKKNVFCLYSAYASFEEVYSDGHSFTACGFNKCVKKKLLCAVLLLICVFMLAGCDPYAEVTPCNEAAVWVCADPYIVLSYQYNEDGILTESSSMVLEGNTIPLNFGYRSDRFWLHRKSNQQRSILTGIWKYRENQLVFEIEEDNIFGGKYTELVFETEDDVELPKQYANLWKKHFLETAVALVLTVLVSIAKPGIVIIAVIAVIWLLTQVFRRKPKKQAQKQDKGSE